jgi:hypothetical protein
MRDIIEMALEAKVAFDLDEYPDIWQVYLDVGKKEIEHFAALVRADERETCAALADKLEWADNKGVASAIRAGGT